MEAVNIYPELIKWKPNKQGLVPIAIRFDYKRQRVAYDQISHRIHPDDWNAAEKKVKSSFKQHVLLNQLIGNRLNKHRNYFLKRDTFNLPITKELIKMYVSGGNLESFCDYAEKLIENKKLKDGQGYSEDTKRRYRDEIKRLTKYQEEITFKDITEKFLKSYKLWLQNDYKKKDGKPLNKNSIWKALSFMQMVYNEAIDDEIILPDDNPFKKFEVGTYEEHPDKIKYLEVNEVEALEQILISHTNNMEDLTIRVGWRFLSMCVSGLRISDAMMLNDMFFNDVGDLELTPHKTRRYGNTAQIPIVSERQRRYLQRTISLPLPPTDPKSFRTTFNIHLKILCAAAGIASFTSHAGRHTMGSLLVDANVEDKAAMRILGVKSNNVIKTYMHLKQSKLRSEASKLANII